MEVTLLTKIGHDPRYEKPGAQVDVDDVTGKDWISRNLALKGHVKPSVKQYAAAPGYSPMDFDEKHQADAEAGNLRATDNSDNQGTRAKDENENLDPKSKTEGDDEHPGSLDKNTPPGAGRSTKTTR